MFLSRSALLKLWIGGHLFYTVDHLAIDIIPTSKDPHPMTVWHVIVKVDEETSPSHFGISYQWNYPRWYLSIQSEILVIQRHCFYPLPAWGSTGKSKVDNFVVCRIHRSVGRSRKQSIDWSHHEIKLEESHDQFSYNLVSLVVQVQINICPWEKEIGKKSGFQVTSEQFDEWAIVTIGSQSVRGWRSHYRFF